MTAAEGSAAAQVGRTPYLSIRGLSKLFGEFAALTDISLDVYEGDFVCFLGPSGCGKTTLLRAIAGLDIQTAGSVVQAGRDISRLPPSERDFGIVFQSYALFPNLTVTKNVAYGLDSRRGSRAETARRVSELLELVGLVEHADKYPAQLSGGQQQRVALARALATSPGLLLLDEPLSALDAKVRVHLRHEIRTLQDKLGVTTIMVTHDQEEALTMADQIVVMNQGVVEQVGTPEDIYGHPATPFIADFVGSMNSLKGVATQGGYVRVGAVEFAAGGTLRPGMAATVCIRPEDVTVRGVAASETNAFPVRIGAIEFLGSFWRVTLRSEGNGGFELLADFSTNLVRDLDLREGARIVVAVPPERILVFAGGGPRP
ncbi:MAG: amino acid ABC transporter substrate-binding protein [Rhodospirillales bacterium RIFCSPLOWO2_12_FULL_67_15]|nr:MAG: amino acid ABC transporter substrate-binding protein [Rhodospirillales bacterium RIFCSPLOWO2_12_FULL_67_15]